MGSLARMMRLSLILAVLFAVGGAEASAQSGPGGGGAGGEGDDERPTASFVFSPPAPTVGETVTFTSTSRPSEGSQITDYAWDFDGVGGFDDFNGATATWSFSAPGTYVVRLRVRQNNGRQAVGAAEVVVAAPPPPPPPPPGSPPPATSPLMMSPFPIIRIAGTVLPRGALVSVLSVRAALGVRIRARCRGTGCPVAYVSRISRTRTVRLRRFERRLRAGIRIGIFVRKGNTIGKYTRFLIRAGAPPRRVDLCLYPGRTRPAPCP
jgi:plastocyanin